MLKEALSSLTRQIRMPDEVVVVDNNSTDNTKETVESFKEFFRLKYIFEKKQGVSEARNSGIINSSGDIIAFMDDDSIADEKWLLYLEQPFLEDPSIGVVGGKTYIPKTTDNLIERFCITDAMLWEYDTHLDSSSHYLAKTGSSFTQVMFPTVNMAIRRVVVSEVGMFDTYCKTGEDVDLGIRVSKTRWNLYFEPKAIVMHKPRQTFISLIKQHYLRGKYHPYIFKKNNQKGLDVFIWKNGWRSLKINNILGIPLPFHAAIVISVFHLFHLSVALLIFSLIFKIYLLSLISIAGIFFFGSRYCLPNFNPNYFMEWIRSFILRYIINWAYLIGAFWGGLKIGMIYVGPARNNAPLIK